MDPAKTRDKSPTPEKGQMRKGSIYAIVGLLAVALFVSLAMQIMRPSHTGEMVAKVTVDGELVAVLPLSQDTRQAIQSEGGVNTVVVENGGVHIEDADCKGGDCMKQGTIDTPGRLLVCLPHKLIVEIIPTDGSAALEPSVYTGSEVVGAEGAAGSSGVDTVSR